MSPKALSAFLMILCYLVYSECVSTRLYFSRCDRGGFSCLLKNNKYNVTFRCPVYDSDTTFYLWQFAAIATTQTVLIKDCKHFRLSFQCTNENKPIIELRVENVENLYIIKASVSHNPQTVIFENITNLEYIPEGTFAQRKAPVPGCFNPTTDLQFLSFKNVSIGTIAPKSFDDLTNFINFSWNNVKVRRLQHVAVQVELGKTGNFSIEGSYLEVCEHLAFKIIGRNARFHRNEFVDVFSGAINGTIEQFDFTNNNVNTLQSYAVSILAEEVHISGNKFEYLRAGAFERISPGLLKDSQRNFGTLNFVYSFTRNSVAFMDAGSLNPDVQAYNNVAKSLIFNWNTFFCTCDNIAWIFSQIGYGHGTQREYYETVLREERKNTCNNTSCDLLLQKAKGLAENGSCVGNMTAENLCDVDYKRKSKIVNVDLRSNIFGAITSDASRSNSLNGYLLTLTSVFIVLLKLL